VVYLLAADNCDRADKKFKRHFCPMSVGAHPRSSPHLDAASHLCTAFFLLVPVEICCLYTAHMCRIVSGSSWHFHRFPPGRGGSYGASGCHLRTPGPQPHGALSRDRGAPGGLSRLAR